MLGDHARPGCGGGAGHCMLGRATCSSAAVSLLDCFYGGGSMGLFLVAGASACASPTPSLTHTHTHQHPSPGCKQNSTTTQDNTGTCPCALPTDVQTYRPCVWHNVDPSVHSCTVCGLTLALCYAAAVVQAPCTYCVVIDHSRSAMSPVRAAVTAHQAPQCALECLEHSGIAPTAVWGEVWRLIPPQCPTSHVRCEILTGMRCFATL